MMSNVHNKLTNVWRFSEYVCTKVLHFKTRMHAFGDFILYITKKGEVLIDNTVILNLLIGN